MRNLMVLVLIISGSFAGASTLSTEEVLLSLKKKMIETNVACGLEISDSIEKWTACSDISRSLNSTGLRRIDSLLYTLENKTENYSFLVEDSNKKIVSKPYYTSLALVCRDMGRSEQIVKEAISSYGVIEGIKLSETQKIVDLQNAQIDLSNAIFAGCALGEAELVNQVKPTLDGLRSMFEAVLAGTY